MLYLVERGQGARIQSFPDPSEKVRRDLIPRTRHDLLDEFELSQVQGRTASFEYCSSAGTRGSFPGFGEQCPDTSKGLGTGVGIVAAAGKILYEPISVLSAVLGRELEMVHQEVVGMCPRGDDCDLATPTASTRT